ncbi:hypothetical protein BC830DRAFT_1106075 [Chytriomyces sp. MP71]|nr:hypothetical protein BC830DRAFT_1106075 [Chytriomyces sp. MP71]
MHHRLVTNGAANIRVGPSPIPYAGKGVFAAKAFVRNEPIVAERPFLSLIRRDGASKAGTAPARCPLCWAHASSAASEAGFCTLHAKPSPSDALSSLLKRGIERLNTLPGYDALHAHHAAALRDSNGREGAYPALVTRLVSLSLADLLATGSLANSYNLFAPLLKAKAKPVHALPEVWKEEYEHMARVLLQGKGLRDMFTMEWYADQMTRLNLNSIAAAFTPRGASSPVEGTTVYLTAAMLNHSCLPNVRVDWYQDNEIKVIADRDIDAGDELSISYSGPVDLATARDENALAERREFFRFNYGFVCTCPLCTGELHGSGKGSQSLGMDEVKI